MLGPLLDIGESRESPIIKTQDFGKQVSVAVLLRKPLAFRNRSSKPVMWRNKIAHYLESWSREVGALLLQFIQFISAMDSVSLEIYKNKFIVCLCPSSSAPSLWVLVQLQLFVFPSVSWRNCWDCRLMILRNFIICVALRNLLSSTKTLRDWWLINCTDLVLNYILNP